MAAAADDLYRECKIRSRINNAGMGPSLWLGHAAMKTRFVCVSDTHNAFPGAGFTLPQGDVLVHAGDLTNQGSFSELERAIKWIEAADFDCKIVIAGNHDITLDKTFYETHGSQFHSQVLQDAVRCRQLFENSESITYLNHEARDVQLASKNGPQTKFKVFGSPYSPKIPELWAFGYLPESGLKLWSAIPLDTDVLVTHTPPRRACDMFSESGPVGCESLCHALRQIQPRLAICGHVHNGRGVQEITWDLSDGPALDQIVNWQDPAVGNRKLSRVNLPLKLPSNGHAARSTCVVNAAIVASRRPHKTFNKPIVVDVELPATSNTIET